MVEMLGTLAIIGILSALATYGYQIAIRHHRANQVLNDINLVAADIVHRDVKYNPDAIIIANASEEGYDLKIHNMVSVVSTENEHVFAVIVHDLDPRICHVLLNKASDEFDRIDVGMEEPITFAGNTNICGEEKDTQIAFFFSTTSDRLAENEKCDSADDSASCCYAKHGNAYVWTENCGCNPRCEGECAYFDNSECRCNYSDRTRVSSGACCVGKSDPVPNYVSQNCESCEEGSISDLTKSCCFYNLGATTAGWVCADNELNTAGKNCCIRCNRDTEKWASHDKTCCPSGKVTSATGQCCPANKLAASNQCCDNSLAGANTNEDCCSVYTTPNATGIPTRYYWTPDGHCCQITFHWDKTRNKCVK